MGESRFIRHDSCPDCDSSDALAIYSDHTFCFACQKFTKGETPEKAPRQEPIRPMKPLEDLAPWESDHYRGIPKRVLDQYNILKTEKGVAFLYRGDS